MESMEADPQPTDPKEPGSLDKTKLAALGAVLAACSFPHVDPAPRNVAVQLATIVALQTDCSEPDPFLATPDVPHDATPGAFPIVWIGPRRATAVLISERFAITGAHAVSCPSIPSVLATLPDGRHRKMLVERDDIQFPVGEPSDVARLELSAANGFGLGVTPPVLGVAHEGDVCCAITLRGGVCGTIDSRGRLGAALRVHDTGGPVYCGSALVGIVTGGTSAATTFEPLDSYWLEGT